MSGDTAKLMTPDRGSVPERVLLIQTAFLGDVVLTLPLLDAAQDLWPGCEFTTLTLPSTASIFKDHPAVRETLILPKRRWDKGFFALPALVGRIKGNHFDLALVPHRSYRSGLIAKQAGIPRRIGFEGTPAGNLCTTVVERDIDLHESARNLALLGDSVKDFPVKPVLRKSASDETAALGWLKSAGLSNGESIIAIAPGSVWETKRWLRTHWISLSRLLAESGHSVVIVGGIEDRELGEMIRREVNNSSVHVAAGDLGVRASAELLRKCRLLVTNDTAPLHLAVGVATPVLAIFGPTIPEFGFAPIGSGDRVIGLDLYCRGCEIHGSNRCPLGHHDCMRLLDPRQVFDQALEMLKAE